MLLLSGSSLCIPIHGSGKSMWFLSNRSSHYHFCHCPHCFFRTIEVKGYCFFFKVLCTESTLCYGYNDSLLLILIHGAGKSMLFPTASAITACLSSVFLNTATRTLPDALASKVSLIPSCTVLLSPRCLISPVVRALRSRVACAIKPSAALVL